MKRNKKKAFTLAELLIVVVVIGILAGLGIPKMRRVLETRKTTEAEEALTALRTEQEKNCIFKGAYQEANKLDTMASIQRSKNYSYGLEEKGAVADAKGSEYVLRMPSYQDGRICCTGDDCSKLNKNYPSCADMVVSDDGTCIMATLGEPTGECTDEPPVNTRNCGCMNTGTQTRTVTCEDGHWVESAWSECSVPACECTTNREEEELCGCENKGKRKRTTPCVNGFYGTPGEWTACSVDDCPTEPPSECTNGQTKEEGTRPCDCDGTETQKWICKNGHWVENGWTECNGNCGCVAPKEWNGTECACPGEGAWYVSSTNTCCSPSTPQGNTSCWAREWTETGHDSGVIGSCNCPQSHCQEGEQCQTPGETCTYTYCDDGGLEEYPDRCWQIQYTYTCTVVRVTD